MQQNDRYQTWQKLIQRDDGWFGVPVTKEWYNGETFSELKTELLRILDLCKDFDQQFDKKFLTILKKLNDIPFLITDKSCTGHSKNDDGYLSIYIENIELWYPILDQMRCWVANLEIDNVIPYPKITFRWKYNNFIKCTNQLLEILPNINNKN